MENRKPIKETVERSFDDAMHLCYEVVALVKYGHFAYAAKHVRSADFLDSELKDVVCRHLESDKEFLAPFVLDPFIKRICGQQTK